MVNHPKSKYNVYNRNTCYTNNCIPQELVIENVRLAAAYVPYQYLCQLFNPIETLKKGTAFPELFSPYDVTAEYKACEKSELTI